MVVGSRERIFVGRGVGGGCRAKVYTENLGQGAGSDFVEM
jgi:hypothetical protein